MTDLAQCPECQQIVRVPEISRPCRFQCPACQAQFDDGALSDFSAPELTVLAHDGQPFDTGLPEDRGAKPTETDETQLPQVIPRPERETVRPNPMVDAAQQRATVRRRPKKMISWELIKIALGGLAGLIIAQLILWWLPGNLRRDPLRLAVQVPESLHFVLPKELRSKPVLERNNAPDADTGGPNVAVNSNNSSTFADRSPPRSNGTSNRPLQFEPNYSASDLRRALVTMNTQLQDQDATLVQDRDIRRARLRQLYLQLCQVAQIVTFVDVDDDETDQLMQATEELLQRVANSAELMDLVGKASADWIRFSSRDCDGLALAGQVASIDAIGDRYELQIQLPDVTKTMVHLVRDIDPALDPRHAVHVGQRIIVLGSILSDSTRPQVRYGIHWVIRTVD